jgi:hypothetical protein
MSGQAKEVTPGDVGSSGDPTSNRAVLAGELEKMADTLTKVHWRLTHSFPSADQDAMTLWQRGVENMKKYVKAVERLQSRCKLACADDAEQEPQIPAEGDIEDDYDEELFDDAEDDGEVDALAETLDQLDQAVELAYEKINAAIDALGGSYLPSVRSHDYREAAAQLMELSSRCAALAVQMRGPAALA